MMEVKEIAIKTLKEIKKESNNIWKDSLYEDIRSIEIDKRGSFGERLFFQCLTLLYPRRAEYKDGDQGDWDIKIGKNKLEVKTASLDTKNKFQNEGIKREGNYTGILFLGVAPNELYFKIVDKNSIDFTKLHHRELRKTGRGYKWDFYIKDMIILRTLDDLKQEFERVFPSSKIG